MKIILGSKESVNAKNKDYQLSLNFNNSQTLYDEFLINKIVDESVQFQKERDNCTDYLLYGKIESIVDDYLVSESFTLNDKNYEISIGYISHYEPTADSLISFTINGKNISVPETSKINKNDIVLLYKGNDDIIFSRVLDKIVRGSETLLSLDFTGNTTGYRLVPTVAKYNRLFTPIHTDKYIKFYNSAFSTNIFEERVTQYNTYKNISLKGFKNNLGLPITEALFRYKHREAGVNYFFKKTLKVTGSNVIDLVTMDLNNLDYVIEDTVIHKFLTGLNGNIEIFQLGLDFYYNPHHIIKIKYFSSVITDTNVNNIFEYPDHAKVFNNGDVFFKKLLSVGYLEEGVNGVDYPFINNIHYLYSDIKFPVRRIIPIATYNQLPLKDELEYEEEFINQEFGKGGRIC